MNVVQGQSSNPTKPRIRFFRFPKYEHDYQKALRPYPMWAVSFFVGTGGIYWMIATPYFYFGRGY